MERKQSGDGGMQRRQFLQTSLAGVAGSLFAGQRGWSREPAAAVEQAHAELWRRFIDRYGVLLDFTDLDGSVNLPTPEECREGKPNALGWFQPIENGAMFTGLYLDAAVSRWQATQAPEDAAKARRLMEGLLLLNSISDVKGFVGRGVSTDGRAHYPMGSNDQTFPWYFGLWRYLQAGPVTTEERERILAHLTETTDAIVALGWQMPAEAPYHIRGTFQGDHFDEAARQLFVMKLMAVLTTSSRWDELYQQTLAIRGGTMSLTKREICARGMQFWYAPTHNWTSCGSVAGLRGLWELETDPELKADFAAGLGASADLAAASLPLYEKFDPDRPSEFSQDWRRAMLPLWKPQTETEAVELAIQQLKAFEKISPRRRTEAAYIREPSAAAWIVTLCPEPDRVSPHQETIEHLIAHFDYTRLYYSTFFWVEAAWWRLRGMAG